MPEISTLLNIILRTTVVYVVLFVGMRLLGKRELSQLTVVDLILLLLVPNAVQNAMVGSDTSLVGGLTAALLLLVLTWLLFRLFRWSPRAASLFEGHPTLLVNNGKIVEANCRREHIDHDELISALREHGVEGISQVKAAILEVDGSISVIPSSAPVSRTKRLRSRANRS